MEAKNPEGPVSKVTRMNSLGVTLEVHQWRKVRTLTVQYQHQTWDIVSLTRWIETSPEPQLNIATTISSIV